MRRLLAQRRRRGGALDGRLSVPSCGTAAARITTVAIRIERVRHRNRLEVDRSPFRRRLGYRLAGAAAKRTRNGRPGRRFVSAVFTSASKDSRAIPACATLGSARDRSVATLERPAATVRHVSVASAWV